MSSMQTFKFKENDIRVVVENNEPLFNAYDLCYILEYKNGRGTIARLFGNDVAKYYPIKDKLGREQKARFLTESQMYKLIMRSKAKNSEAFQDWIIKEVLSSIKGKQVSVKESTQIMQGDIKLFNFGISEIRMTLINDEPYFIAMDIANVLGYTDTEAMTRRLDRDEIINRQIVGFGYRGVNCINESGLYNAILGSKKENAKEFKRWVTKEVLPSIRKTGGYEVKPQIDLTNPLSVLEALKDSVEKQIVLYKENEVLKLENKKQSEKIENYESIEKTRRSKQELATKLNRTIRKLAEQQFNRDYGSAYLYVYKKFSELHCINEEVNMDYLKKNIDYLAECLAIATMELN